MPLIWLIGGAVLLGSGIVGWRVSDDISDQLDKARPWLLAMLAAYMIMQTLKARSR